MILPEKSYNFTEMDLAGTLAEFYLERVADSQAVPNVEVSFPAVPAGKLLIVSAVCGWAQAGAAQTVSRILLRVTVAGTTYLFAVSYPAVQNAGLTLPTTFCLPQGAVLKIHAQYNAGVANNNLEASISGFLVPRGGVAL